jgi:hypothetical protein
MCAALWHCRHEASATASTHSQLPMKETSQMARNLRLDDQDQRALRALDDGFTFSADNEVAVVEGEMRVEVTRFADDARRSVPVEVHVSQQ